MSSLHSQAPAHSLQHTKATLSRAFDGRRFDDIFEEFQEEPLGVGAIAQVYKAKLKPNLAALANEDLRSEEPNIRQRVRKNVDVLVKSTPSRVPSSYVAIKILHPNVERMVRRDIRIIGAFAAIINAIPTLEWYDLPNEVAQFGEMMRLQLDLRIEAANLTMFRKKFKDRTTAWFPFPYSDYTTRQVLVEEFAHGIPLAAFLEDGGGVFQKEIADEGLDAFYICCSSTTSSMRISTLAISWYASTNLNRSLSPSAAIRNPRRQTMEQTLPRKSSPSYDHTVTTQLNGRLSSRR